MLSHFLLSSRVISVTICIFSFWCLHVVVLFGFIMCLAVFNLCLHFFFVFSSMSLPFGAGRGRGGLYSWLFLCSLLAFLSMSEVKGKTLNAHVELSDAVSNVVHCSEQFKYNKSTLSFIRRAVDALVNPVVRSLSSDPLIFLALIHCFQHVYLDQLARDPAALARSNYLCLLVTARHAYKLSHRKHNPTYIFLAAYKQIQAFLAQHEKPPVSVFFLLYYHLCPLSFSLVPLSILLRTRLLLKLPLLRYTLFSSFLCNLGYLYPAFPYPGSPLPYHCH